MATLPEGVGFHAPVNFVDKPTNTFLIDWASRQVSGMDSGLAAMRQAVEIMLQNERFEWQIYSSDFGCELEALIGEEYDYIISEIPRRINDAFSTDSRILSVENFSFSRQEGNSIKCSFDVVTVFGTCGEEVVL